MRRFAEHQRGTLTELEVETLPGVRLGHRHVPVDAVGSYVPGGRYPMVASAFMTIVVPRGGGRGPRGRRARRRARGAASITPRSTRSPARAPDQIVCLGGVQALAAMAFGLGEIEPVDMIVGAGNAYVAEAKRQLFGRVGIDLLAGPTEILVLADESADPELVAADLLGQAEHGPTSPAVLVTTSRALGVAVVSKLERLLRDWPTREVAGEAWSDVRRDRRGGGSRRGDRDSERLRPRARRGPRRRRRSSTPTSTASATTARCSSARRPPSSTATRPSAPTTCCRPRARRATPAASGSGKFLKTVTYQRLTDEGTRRVAPAAAAISDAEAFAGHALTARMRLERLGVEA